MYLWKVYWLYSLHYPWPAGSQKIWFFISGWTSCSAEKKVVPILFWWLLFVYVYHLSSIIVLLYWITIISVTLRQKLQKLFKKDRDTNVVKELKEHVCWIVSYCKLKVTYHFNILSFACLLIWFLWKKLIGHFWNMYAYLIHWAMVVCSMEFWLTTNECACIFFFFRAMNLIKSGLSFNITCSKILVGIQFQKITPFIFKKCKLQLLRSIYLLIMELGVHLYNLINLLISVAYDVCFILTLTVNVVLVWYDTIVWDLPFQYSSVNLYLI